MSGPAATWRLLALLLALVAVDGVVQLRSGTRDAPLPGIAAVDPGAVGSIAIRQGDEVVELEKRNGSWFVTHPYSHPADPAAVAGVLALARGVGFEARVDSGNHDRYGLDGADPIRVELTGAGAALRSLYLGHDAPDGTSFVRLPDDDTVYRARVGGRARFERPTGAWRDAQLWRADPRQVVRLQVDRAEGEPLVLQRGPSADPAIPGPWILAADPAFEVDPVLAGAVVSALASLRATEVFSADHPAHPAASGPTLALTLATGEVLGARIGLSGDQGYAAIEGREGTYALPGRLVHRLLAPTDAWRDRTLWALQGVRAIEWIDGERRVRVERDGRTGLWIGREPAGVAVDSRTVAALASFLAQPRVEDFRPPEPAYDLPGRRAIVVVGDSVRTLQLGAFVGGALDGRDAVAVRDPLRPDRVGLLEAELVERLMGPLSAPR